MIGAALARTPLAAGEVDRALAQQGARLAEVGSAERGVLVCANCHGPSGSGVPPDVPRLAGQSANYIAAQVPALNNGQRKNDPLAMMRGVATRLTPEDMQAVAQCQAAQDGDMRMAGR